MKKTILAGAMILAVNFAFGQRVDRDPTYSIHNYKHPNKAAYARKHLDRSIALEMVDVHGNHNYKQPFNNAPTTKKGAVASRKMDKSTKSYKHPYGL